MQQEHEMTRRRILLYINGFITTALLMTLLSLTASCGGRRGAGDSGSYRTIEMDYATLITMHEGAGYVYVQIANPWDSLAPPRMYVLIPADSEVPVHIPNGEIVRTPISNAAVFSSVHCGLMEELGALKSIRGVCDLQYINIPSIQEAVKKGSITDLGQSVSPDVEKLIDINPGAILLSPYENSGSFGALGSLGVPIIECADYMENSPLARAEWIKFYGLLCGQQRQADSIFKAVEKSYNAMCKAVAKEKDRPTVALELKTGATWYVAGARTTTARYYSDAGAEYVFSDIDDRGSVPLDPESVFERSAAADYWLFKYAQTTEMTYEELAEEYPAYGEMKAFQTGKVYACNTSKKGYFEQTPFHPDRLLRDLIMIFHPGVLDEGETHYFSPLIHRAR